MEIWSFAQTELIESEVNTNLDLTLKILNSNSSTPVLEINNDGTMGSHLNIADSKIKNKKLIDRLKEQFKDENTPIEVIFDGKLNSTIYYGIPRY